jgi:hypothetical protein
MKTSNDSADASSVVSISIAEHIIYTYIVLKALLGADPFDLKKF